MTPECQSLPAVFARHFPQAHITLITSEQQYVLNLFRPVRELLTPTILVAPIFLH